MKGISSVKIFCKIEAYTLIVLVFYSVKEGILSGYRELWKPTRYHICIILN